MENARHSYFFRAQLAASPVEKQRNPFPANKKLTVSARSTSVRIRDFVGMARQVAIAFGRAYDRHVLMAVLPWATSVRPAVREPMAGRFVEMPDEPAIRGAGRSDDTEP